MHYHLLSKPFFIDSTEISFSLNTVVSELVELEVIVLKEKKNEYIAHLKFPVFLALYKEIAFDDYYDIHRNFSIEAHFKAGLYK